MRGYRTLIFAAIMAVAGVFGHHLAPDLVNSYLDTIFAAAAFGVAVMRWLTTTPMGLSSHPALADLANLLAAATAKGAAPVPDVNASGGPTPDAPASGGATITGPPPDLVAMATSVVNALATIQSVHAGLAQQLAAANAAVSAALPAAPAADPAPAPVPQPAAPAAGQAA